MLGVLEVEDSNPWDSSLPLENIRKLTHLIKVTQLLRTKFLVPSMGDMPGPGNAEMKWFLETQYRRRRYVGTDLCTQADRCCDRSYALFRHKGGGSQHSLM